MESNSKETGAFITDDEKKTLLKVVRETIESVSRGEAAPVFRFDAPLYSQKRGVFVTLHIGDELRGCIGYAVPFKPLLQAIVEMAQAAAMRDPRFEPVTPAEVPELSIEISVLTPLELIKDVATIRVGQHGLYIENEVQSGLLLPQVATEYGWDRKTFLEHTCLKAGLPKNAWKDKETRISIFSAQIFSEAGLAFS